MEEKKYAKVRTPARMLEAVRRCEEVRGLYRKQVENMGKLTRVLMWGVFRPEHFRSQGKWSTSVIGTVTDVTSLKMCITYPDGDSEVIPFSELPIELWPLEQLPVECHPRVRGTPYGQCWRVGCTAPLASWLDSEDDKFYCGRCAQEKNFKNPGQCSVPKGMPGPPIRTMSRMQAGEIQRKINAMGLVTLDQFVDKTRNLFEKDGK